MIDDNKQEQFSTVLSEPEIKTTQNKKSKLINSIIISSVCILISVAVALVAIFAIPNATDNTESSSQQTSSQSISVLNLNIDDIKSYSIKNSKAAFTAVQITGDSQEESKWQMTDYEKYDMPSLTYFAESIATLSAVKSYEKTLSDEKYGFDEPVSTITVNFNDKTKKVITVGHLSPEKTGYYVQVSDDNNIYVVSDTNFASYIIRDKFNFISATAINPATPDSTSGYFGETGQIAVIDYLTLSGGCRKDKIVINSPPEELASLDFIVTEPAYRVCEYEKVMTMLTFASSGLYSSGAYKLDYTSSDIAEYGLNKPFSVFECKIGDYNFKASFGKADEDGFYPCIVSGDNAFSDNKIIYKISKEQYDFIENDGTDVYLDSLFSEFIANVDSMKIKTDKKSLNFTLDRSDNGPSDPDSIFKVYIDDTEIEKMQFGFLYERLIQFNAEEYDTIDLKDKTPSITITVSYLEDFEKDDDIIELYKVSDRRYCFVLNGLSIANVAATNVDDFYSSALNVAKGVEISRP